MKTNWIPTNEYYHRILDTAVAEEQEKLYVELFVQPWQQMMDMVGRSQGDDPLAGAKGWGWLLPDQLEKITAVLTKLETADAWRIGADALATAAARFAPFADRIPFDTIDGWLMLADETPMNAFERGYTGATDWFQPRLIGQFWDPNETNLPRLPGLVAHEMHHLIRFRAFPFHMNITVGEYIVLEGLAESFATAVFGQDVLGYYVTDVTENDLATAQNLIGQHLHTQGFNVIRGYIFGDALADRGGFEKVGMPTYGGYAVGYHLVQAFLQRSGCTIEETTFISADEIIAGSGLFD